MFFYDKFFNNSNKETIYIGDSESDSLAVHNAFIHFGYASWENKNAISQYDYLFERPQDINKSINK